MDILQHLACDPHPQPGKEAAPSGSTEPLGLENATQGEVASAECQMPEEDRQWGLPEIRRKAGSSPSSGVQNGHSTE